MLKNKKGILKGIRATTYFNKKKKKEYVQRRRSLATQVGSTLIDKDMIDQSLKSKTSPSVSILRWRAGSDTFFELLSVRERIEDGICDGKLAELQ